MQEKCFVKRSVGINFEKQMHSIEEVNFIGLKKMNQKIHIIIYYNIFAPVFESLG